MSISKLTHSPHPQREIRKQAQAALAKKGGKSEEKGWEAILAMLQPPSPAAGSSTMAPPAQVHAPAAVKEAKEKQAGVATTKGSGGGEEEVVKKLERKLEAESAETVRLTEKREAMQVRDAYTFNRLNFHSLVESFLLDLSSLQILDSVALRSRFSSLQILDSVAFRF